MSRLTTIILLIILIAVTGVQSQTPFDYWLEGKQNLLIKSAQEAEFIFEATTEGYQNQKKIYQL